MLITLKTKCETRGRRRGRRLTAGVDLNVLVTKVLKEGEEEGGAEDPAQKMKQLDTRCVPDNAGRDAGLYPRKHFTTLRARLNAWCRLNGESVVEPTTGDTTRSPQFTSMVDALFCCVRLCLPSNLLQNIQAEASKDETAAAASAALAALKIEKKDPVPLSKEETKNSLQVVSQQAAQEESRAEQAAQAAKQVEVAAKKEEEQAEADFEKVRAGRMCQTLPACHSTLRQ